MKLFKTNQSTISTSTSLMVLLLLGGVIQQDMNMKHHRPNGSSIYVAAKGGSDKKGGKDDSGSSTILEVDDSGAGDYLTLQEAVDAASPGDTIVVNEYTTNLKGWQVQLTIDKEGLTIIGGEGKSKPIIKAVDAPKKDDEHGDKRKEENMKKSQKLESLFTSRKFLTEQHCPKVILDGCISGTDQCGQDIITIDAPDVTIENFFFRHGEIILTDNAHNTVIANNCFWGDTDFLIKPPTKNFANPKSTLHDVTIEGNFFQGGRKNTIYINGDNHIVRNNAFVTVHEGITVDGDSNSIIGNAFVGCSDICIQYNNGLDGVITDNTILYSKNGIEYYRKTTGGSVIVDYNVIKGVSEEGIYARCVLKYSDAGCVSGSISYNHIIGSGGSDPKIGTLRANNFDVKYNDIYYGSYEGLYIDGNDNTIQGNIVSRHGVDSTYCSNIRVIGDDNEIIENESYFSTYDGIVQEDGNGNMYRRNVIRGSGRAGIEVQGEDEIILEENIIEDGQGEGIAVVGGVNHVIVNNELTNNRIDICWGTYVPTDGSTFNDNTYETGGIDTSCEVVVY